MATQVGDRAIEAALGAGNALLKFISPNDAGITGTHQEGFYLPKGAWKMFSPHPPEKGMNAEEEVEITWHDGSVTMSRIKWYGKDTRSEYRLTRFGKDFPFHNAEVVGDLWVLVPRDHWHFESFVLDTEEDIEELQAALGVEPFERWGVYQGGVPQIETESDCFERLFRTFAAPLIAFPTGEEFSAASRAFVEECVKAAKSEPLDGVFMRWLETEYQLFQRAERQICQKEIARTFRDVDDFLKTARSIGNRRMSRAGRSLENHVDYVLRKAGVPHDMRPPLDGNPDVVIPSADAYRDESFPLEKLCVVGVKTTCKDRWRQILYEAPRVTKKHILTTQKGISSNQLTQMQEAGVTLVVPEKLHRYYPKHSISLLTIDQFIEETRARLS